MFKRVLVANRGEIAVRVMRTLRRLRIQSVAMYSDADARTLHTRSATEAHPLRGTLPAETYLDQEKILEIAKTTGADAVHPGYGFLSENPSFAAAVEAAGMSFIGPSPSAMMALGDKVKGRAAASKAGLPVAPGSLAGLADAEEASTEASRIGFPVILKASGGGGGIGMRIVRTPQDMAREFAAAKATADSAFKGSAVFVEKFIERPRHIEFQFIADSHGNCVYFPERECSVQRRYQKLIEESPSPGVSDVERRRIGALVTRLALDVGYENAGTAEFLLSDGSFYFNEVNARLQVEHPVTEAVCGVDLVELQLRVAAGEALPIRQDAIAARGHAIECRINAEDVSRDFAPSPGHVRVYEAPSGPFVRVDGFLAAGDDVVEHYDSLIAKAIAWAPTRDEAIDRMRALLEDFRIEGPATTLPFHLAAMGDPGFRAGRLSTSFVDESGIPARLKADADARAARMTRLAAALAADIHANPSGAIRLMDRPHRGSPGSKWANAGRARQMRGGKRA
ncbi:MAG: ATP-grasp domain-containing protein [Euryarchaeota archaeon]|nr:ATP-grasp domain-containing protein [Euryarchaeota archaeon]